MFQNYFKIAFRNLIKERLFSVINVVGLSIGTAVVILLMLFVIDEWTFDTFHSKSERLYRAWVNEHYQGEDLFGTVVPIVLGTTLKEEVPGVEDVCRLYVMQDMVKRGTFSREERIHLVDPSFFKLFDFQLEAGDPSTALASKNQVVISEEIAGRFFRSSDPIGQSLTIQMAGQPYEFLVAGIIENAPSNSSIQYDMLIPFDNIRSMVSERAMLSWFWVGIESYVLLAQNAQVDQVAPAIQHMVDEKVKEDYPPSGYEAGLQEMTDIHLNNSYPEGIAQVNDWRYPYILGGIALLILLLAAINFTTLAVGRSISRAREVGVRKATGATRWQLMMQFWTEAVLVASISVAIGFLLAELLLPAYNQLANTRLALPLNVPTILLAAGFALLLGLISGIYPALVLSGFTPLKTLRGSISDLGAGKHLLLRSLVGLQFALSIALIVSTLVMNKQIRYLQNKNLGFDRDQMLVLPYRATFGPNQGIATVYEAGKSKGELLKNELLKRPDIEAITVSSHSFGRSGWTILGYTDRESQKLRRFNANIIDYDYLPTMKIELLAGRNFSEANGSDKKAVIINEAMAKAWGWADPVGQYLPEPFQEFQIIGLTRDFNFESLHTKVQPLVMAIDPEGFMTKATDVVLNDSPAPDFTFKIRSEDLQATVAAIEKTWKKVAPDQPFEFAFLDESLDAQYRAEARLSKILGMATGLAIFIACLGLFGMASLTITRRTKEIGVRKVLGASTASIVWTLSRSFTWLILIANIVAIPLAIYVIQGWLSDFAYQTKIDVWLVLGSVLASLGLAWLALSYQSIRAAMANPVKSLKSE